MMARISPITERDTKAIAAPKLTILLLMMPLTSAVPRPAAPVVMYGTTLVVATATSLAPTGSGAAEKNFVLLSAKSGA
jgi:hypothetical protein